MIFEALTTLVMGWIGLKAYLSKSGEGNDSNKINKIFSLTGLNVKDGKETYTAQLLKKRNHEWGTEYRYRIPLGRSFEDYVAKQNHIEDGLNSRIIKMEFRDLKGLKLDRNIIANIKSLYQKKLKNRKEIELSYDGVLIIRVYNDPMPSEISLGEGNGWRVPFGITREKNEPVYHDFEQIPHLALGGATRYGKSNLINCIITSLIRQQPNNVKFHLIDLKGGVELCDYESINQTISIAYEPEEALETLENAYNIMRYKQEILRKAGKKKVQDAGIVERHFVIIDEVGELNPDEAVTSEEKALKKQCQKYMSQISRLGASLGFRQILATQYPTGDVIPRQCKQNSDAKLCFRVQSAIASRVVLDGDGAEKLPKIKGRAIYQNADQKTIIQTPLITPKDIKDTIKPHIIDKGVKKVETIKQKTRSDTLIFEETRLS
ncbi:FtsK/SpoIIIE domain-containing protein [Bacillus sp. FJAT-49736]|uniref:FtsK/SpoIIIE domain-containing protein n=1 Tax=Bacillus sp. FJAT-49736 TaxID=2833582 RepID=UPI001BC9636D|nr:FtsK/SpoIIIE domain-containing protein [Bacillus sp. FJAT-49736]MBS4173460.1 cell division protein FtsK [Bacillus sp. FJAT-49736]